jgi:hypothetical protein
MSLCNQVLDLSDDTNKDLLKEILKENTPPEMVKKAQLATRETHESRGRSDFALVMLTKEGNELRKFPLFDAANTWMSCQYFEKTAHKLPARAKGMAGLMLKRACAMFDVAETPLLKEVANTLLLNGHVYHEAYDITKTAQPISVETVTPDESKHFYACNGRYPMPSPEFVKKASQYFTDHEREFSDPAHRHEFAHNVLERAKELKVEIDQKATLDKYAGEGYGDILETQIRIRHDLLQAKPNMDAALTKVASFKKELTPVDFAKLLHTFDKKASLDKYYDGYLADAYKSTFEVRFTKTASGYSWESSDGVNVSEKELTKAFEDSYDKVKGYFGPTVADSLKKHGCSIFASLPKDAKEVITKIAKGDI